MNILLIEDDAGLVKLISTVVEELGFSVMSAASGAEVLAYLKKETPDLMLLDYSLPDINGNELIETLNKKQIPLPPFIITTGQGDERIAVDMMKLGAKDYLIKDILFLEKLPEVIKRVIKEIESVGKLKEAEEALKESEERFKLAMNATKDGLYDWDLVTNEIYYSPSWKNMLGYKEDELPNDFSIWEKLTEPEDVEKSWNMQQDLINKKRDRFELEFKMKHKKGHWVDILSRAEAVFDDKGKAIRIVGTHVNITERLELENRFKESENKLRVWIENSPVCTKIVDLDFNLQFMSASGVRELNIDDITEYYGISYPLDFYPDSFKIPMTNNLKQVKETGKIITQEAPVVDVDGKELWFHSTIVPVNDDKDKLDYFLVVSLETTKRKQAEIELIDAKEKAERNEIEMERAQKLARIGSWNLDFASNKVNWSYELYKMYGFDPAFPPPILTDSQQLFTPGSWELLSNSIATTGKTGTPYSIELKTIRKDGSNGWMWAQGEAIRDENGEITGLWGAAQDISERKLAEEKLRESEKFSKEIIESMSDGFSILDENGVHIDVNLAFCNMTEFAKEELIGVGPPHPYWPEEEYKNIQEAFVKTSQGNFESFELVFKRKNGKRFPVIVSPSQIKDENGYVISSFATVRDVTESKRVEKELLNYKEHLEETVQDRTRELQDKNDELDRAMKVFVGRELKIRELEKRIGTMGKDK